MTLLPLAFNTPASIASFSPQLATSWHMKGETLDVTLRRGVKWQDGRPVTARDVIDTTVLEGVASSAMWDDITAVSSSGSDHLIFKLNPGISSANAETEVLGMQVLPSSEYGKFVTPGLASSVAKYYKLERSDPNASAAKSLEKELTADYQKLLKYSPAKMIGDGPFRVKAVTNAEAEFVKSSTFYGAAKVHVPAFIWQETTASNNFGEMMSGSGDLSWTGGTWPIYQKEMARGVKLYTPPFYAQGDIYFNNKHYPLNLVQVRQAIAYVIHRPDYLSLADGGKTWNRLVPHPALLFYAVEHPYLSAHQLAELNPYKENLKKAAQLLRSVGFRKNGQGQWITPRGSRFTLTYDVPAGWLGQVESAQIIPKWLTSFGIKTTGSAVEQPAYWTYQDKGQFELDWGWGGWGVDPLQRFADVLGPSMNSGSSTSGNVGIGFGPVVNVPGLGRVNVPNTIEEEAATVPPGPRMDHLTWLWAKFVNQQLPVLSVNDKTLPVQFTTKHYTDWPAKDSPLWNDLGNNTSLGMAFMIESGHIRPVR